MKKLLMFAVVAAGLTVAMQSCKKDNPDGPSGTASLTVENKQRSALIYNTATWCGPCGAYGSPEYKGAIEQGGTDLISLDLHTSGSSYLVPLWMKPANDTLFIAPFASQLYAQTKPNGYIPHFYCSNSFLGNSTVKTADIISFKNTYNANPCEVGVAASAKANGNSIDISYKLQAFSPDAADYYTSVLLIEKGVDGYQAGAAGSFTNHKHIIRASALTNGSNTPVAFSSAPEMSNPAANATVDKKVTYTYSAIPDAIKSKYPSVIYWNYNAANTSVAVLVWKKDTDGSMFFINAVMADVK
ncbi:MAG: hypothetical protein O3C22_05515 [Bacteroidetes bacterium]|nr:hypothetical protein [Bacteroidota bacterium]MDA0943502.1 hypothetical protein [Bacteroidota bacterium]MDA1112125.1 hypothetical protein [Bacteroidota bacterium]